MKKQLITILTLIFCTHLYAQDERSIFKVYNLGHLNKDNTYGNFDGGMCRFKVIIKEYTLNRDVDIIKISGKICDYDTSDTLCNINAFIGTKDESNRKLKFEEQFKVDCFGNFEVSLKLDSGRNIYFWFLGCSLLECEVDKSKI